MKSCLLALVALGCVACTQQRVSFSSISFQSDINSISLNDIADGQQIVVSGEVGEPQSTLYQSSASGLLIYIPPWTKFDSFYYAQKMRDDCGENCIGLLDVSMDYSGYYIPIFYTSESCWVRATPVYMKKQSVARTPKKKQ